MTALHLKLFRDFKTLRTQVVTIAILVICGVSVLVSSWSSYRSLQDAKNWYYGEFRFADIFATVVRAPESVTVSVERLDGVEQVESRIVKDGLVDVEGQAEPAMGRFVAWRGEHQKMNLIYLRQGRFPQRSPIPEILVHESFAEAHRLRTGDMLDIQIEGQRRHVSIAGIGLSPEYVYALSPFGSLPDDKHFGVFWLRQEDMEALTGMSGAFNSLQVKVTETANVNELKRRIDQILQPYGGIQSHDRSRQLSNMFVEDEIRQQRVMAMFMPAIFLAVAMFILNVILSRLMTLHRGQIATLKSLGYGAWTLTVHYFQLVTLILLTGIGPAILVGSLIGKWYAGEYAEFFRFPRIDFSLSKDAIILGVIGGLVPGWIGAMAALIKVFTLRPAEALRPPSPPDFQKGLFDRLGITARMEVLSKMILRSLLFRPFRTLLNIGGIAAALAILINGSFWTDIVDFMMDRQFHEMHREDLTIRLLHPQRSRVYSEIKHLPGVMMIEGERNIPVRIEFDNLKKDIGILGMKADSELSRVLDQSGKIIKPVTGGIVLSRYFADSWRVKPGDLVTLNVLEGTQRRFAVPVMGFVDDMIGQQGYVVKNDLHRWLDEEPAVNTINLKIDPDYLERLYVTLNARPEVANVGIRKLLLESFSSTVADMILTFTFILYFFAVAIAGAVMYNSARIGFSERAWEMASLRILGYPAKTSFELLFVDIGFQVLLALVPGIALGYYFSYLSTRFIHNDTFKFPLVIDLATYGAAVIVLLVTFFASGVFLYRRANRLDLSEALKARE